MSITRRIRWSIVLAAVLALTAAIAAQAASNGRDRGHGRVLYATDKAGKLLSFDARSAERIRWEKSVTGLPDGVWLRGIDFRPATGDLYGVGSDSVVYRVNPRTAIAVAEGPPFTPALRGMSFGLDFNPTVDKIRVTSDANQNLRLNPDAGDVLSADPDLNPGDPNVVGSAYTNSSFTATRPTTTTLFAIDSKSDLLLEQNPANAGTLINPKSLRLNVTDKLGFDIAGASDTAHLATSPVDSRGRKRGARLYTVDLDTGRAKLVGRIGHGGRTITGLAAWQDVR
jgi:Domain of unknown function (DUF4394)